MNRLGKLMATTLMLVAFITVPVAVLAVVNDSNLVGFWHMDGNWLDSSEIGNNGNPNNGVTFSSNGKVGAQSGSFDGVNDYVVIGDPSNGSLDFGTFDFTISAWIKTSASGVYQNILDKRGPEGVGYHLGITNDNKVHLSVLAINSKGETKSNSTVNDGKWHNVVGVLNRSGNALIYIDGLQDGTPGNISGVGDINTGGKAVIGYRNPDIVSVWSFFNGLIDEVAVYKRALSATEIQNYYRTYVVNSPTVNPVTSPTATSTIVLSGTKPANTTIEVNGNTLVPIDVSTTWQASYTLSEGTNYLNITARDGQNFSSLPVTLTAVLDRTPPVVPTIDPVSVPINTYSKLITGIRSNDSVTVAVGCAGATVSAISYPTTTSWSVNVSGLQEGSNTISVYAKDAVGNQSATATATISVDTIPPNIGATPSGGFYNSSQSVVLSANEPAAIYYTLDGSTPTISASLYSRPITIPTSATLRYFAMDLAGNSSETKTELYAIDMTPPVLAISTLSDGAYTNSETMNIAGTVADNIGVSGITVNDAAVQVSADGSFSYALLLKDGANIITITAIDNAGNTSTDTRTVNFDQTAPVLAVAAPADNSKTGTMLLEMSGTVDKTSTVMVKRKDIVQSAIMDGGSFTAAIILEPGYNTIEITAADLAGNHSSQKRTVLYDGQKPSLAIVEPNQDMRTSRSGLTIKGAVQDSLTQVGVTISVDNEVFTPPVVAGTFEQTVNFVTEKTYVIVVTATNEVGASTSVQRNVIYDITPPVLSIDPVSSPTNRSSLTVSGTREAGTAVTVSCATASVGEVSYQSETAWQAEVFGLREGENVVTAASADEAGNAVTARASVVLASRLPEIMLMASPFAIWPPNHQMVPVTIAGGVDTFGADISSVAISVRDEYGQFEYNNLAFGSTVMLEAWRKGNDKDGRKYTITVVVTDNVGNTTAKSATVTVPHDESQLNNNSFQPATKKTNHSLFR